MKLKAKIVGPKVQDVGYRYFLMSMAMSNRIRMFEAHNIESNEVWAFVDGDDEAVKAFRAQAETKRPAKAEVSGIFFDDFEGDIMRIGEYAQFCSTVQLNNAIPLLLDLRDDLKEMKSDMKAVRKTTEVTLEEIKGLREDVQPGYSTNFRQLQVDVRAIKQQLGML